MVQLAHDEFAKVSTVVRNVEPTADPSNSLPEIYRQIGEVAELTGLTQRTLRHYEERGLLRPPNRKAGGFRLYSPDDIARIEHILNLKRLLGFSLEEIKQIIAAEEEHDLLQQTYQHVSDRASRLEPLQGMHAATLAQINFLTEKITQMTLLRDNLQVNLNNYQTRLQQLQEEA